MRCSKPMEQADILVSELLGDRHTHTHTHRLTNRQTDRQTVFTNVF